MTNIPLALRLLECGLDMPKNEPSKTFGGVPFIAIPAVKTKLLVGMNWRSPRGILYTVVATEDGPRLLPDTSDFALSGWIKAEISKLVSGFVGSFPYYSETSQGWHVVVDGPDAVDGPAEMAILNCGPEATEIEALVAAWEAALEAQKGAQ